VYTESGSAQGEFFSLLGSLASAVAELRNTYLNYEAHVVNTVSMLLDYLKQEKLTLVQELLMTAKFDEVSSLTPATISSKGDVEGMLAMAVDMLGGTTPTVEITRCSDPLLDYSVRGVNENIEIEELGDTPI
jgi:hypothetical protein